MLYATKQNMIDRFAEQELIQLTDRANPPAGAIDDTVLNKALADADATINDHLQGRYALPLSVVPLSLERMACELARYYLYDDHPTDTVRTKYEDAIKFLEAVSKGVIKLGVDAQDQSAPVVGTPQTAAPERQFNQETLKDF
jgi:phage gp36-like protein